MPHYFMLSVGCFWEAIFFLIFSNIDLYRIFLYKNVFNNISFYINIYFEFGPNRYHKTLYVKNAPFKNI